MARDDRDILVVERGEGGALKWLVMGAALGAGLALLFAPKSGKEMRRDLTRSMRRVRDLAEGTIDEFRREAGELGLHGSEPEEEREEPGAEAEDLGEERPSRPARPSLVSAREELERRLAAARARRQSAAPEEEEPVA